MQLLGWIALGIFIAWAGIMMSWIMITTTYEVWEESMAWLRRMKANRTFNKNTREWKKAHPDDPFNQKIYPNQ